jgi:hypothetical protein
MVRTDGTRSLAATGTQECMKGGRGYVTRRNKKSWERGRALVLHVDDGPMYPLLILRLPQWAARSPGTFFEQFQTVKASWA